MEEGRGRGSRICWEAAAISPVVGEEALNEHGPGRGSQKVSNGGILMIEDQQDE